MDEMARRIKGNGEEAEGDWFIKGTSLAVLGAPEYL
jgi:hypothetical protein